MRKNNGFTLIEVLVAMIVLALGLVGLARLQAMGLKNNQSSYNRSQAIQLAYDIADRMTANNCLDKTANKLMAENYLITNTAACPGTVVGTACAACEGTANTCTPEQLANKDLYDWQAAVKNTLPKTKEEGYATGKVTKNGQVYTVAVKWDDNQDGAVNANDATFNLNVQLLAAPPECV